MLSPREARQRSGLTSFRIRFYERQGLLGTVARTPRLQRRYSEDQVRRLEQIQQWRRMGLSLQDIRALLGLGGPSGPEELVLRLLARVSDLKRQVEGVSTLAAAAAERTRTDGQTKAPKQRSASS